MQRLIAADTVGIRSVRTLHSRRTAMRSHDARGAGHRTASTRSHASASVPRPQAGLPPVVGPVLNPLRRIGQDLSTVTGWSAFSGPVGWLLTGLLLLAVAMIGAAVVTGRSAGRLHRLTRMLPRPWSNRV